MTDKFSKNFIQVSRLATKAANGFFALGELDGLDAFKASLKQQLKNNGWPIEPQNDRLGPRDPMNQFIEHGITDTRSYSISQSNKHLNLWFNELPTEAEKNFIKSEAGLNILKKSITAATEDTAKTFGDALAVQHHQRSILKAAFDAVAAGIGFGKNDAETKLINILKTLVQTMNTYDAKGVPDVEFRDRTMERLEELKWPTKSVHGHYNSDLAAELSWLIHSATHSKTSIDTRYMLQDDTKPARKPYRAAKDFILSHADDIITAAKQVAVELDAELATPEGLVTRYCRIISEPPKKNKGPAPKA